MATRYNISRPKVYKDANGVEKTAWNTVGYYTEFTKQDGSTGRRVEIPAIGLEAMVFPIVDRDAPQASANVATEPTPTNAEATEEEINPDDIPF